jgi:hypothetical protein
MKRSFALLLLAATACQSTTPELSDSWGALPIHDRIEVEYHGSLRANPSASMKIEEFTNELIGADDERGSWSIKVGVIETTASAVHKLLGEGVLGGNGNLSAVVVSNDEMQSTIAQLIESGDGSMLSEPQMMVYEGTRASMTIANQTAFIDHFDFEAGPDSFLMGPEVGVFLDGFMMDMIPHGLDEAGDASLQFKITWSVLVEMQEVESDYPLGGASITIQVPVFMRQDVSGQLAMGPEEAVVLPVLYGKGDQRLLVIVRVDPMISSEQQAELDSAKQELLRQDGTPGVVFGAKQKLEDEI